MTAKVTMKGEGEYRATSNSEADLIVTIQKMLFIQASFNEGEFMGGVMTVASAIGSFLYEAELPEDHVNKNIDAIGKNARMGYDAQKPKKPN